MYWSDPRIHYVEGYALDRFAAGDWALMPRRSQRIGLLLDSGIEPELAERQIQVAEACRATLGFDLGPVVTTDEPLMVSLEQGPSGASWGCLGHPGALLRAGERLHEAGATAIAVVARFPDDVEAKTLNAYRHGLGVDALGGAEAVISHLLVRHLKIPCAHAPALGSLSLEPQLDPRAAAEELGFTFLACVLVGLHRAPDLIQLPEQSGDFAKATIDGALIGADQLGAVVVPDGALGGEAVLACLERKVPVIAVHNPSLLNVNSTALGLKDCLLHASSYAEAAGFLLALREGIHPDSLMRPFPSIHKLY